jgi:translation initiation factor IF-3
MLKGVSLRGPRRSYRGAPRRVDLTRINHRIRVSEVRLIDEEGNALGIVPTKEALQLAKDKGLDLVEVAAKAKPPVCRIIDYGKYKYEKKQREKAAKKKSSKSTVKELKFRPKIGKHDINVRVKHARKFLLKNYKVRLIVRFRGREHSHPDIAIELLNGVFKKLEDLADVEVYPKKEGAIMLMYVVPNQTKLNAYNKAHTSDKDSPKPSDGEDIDDTDDIGLEDIDDDDIKEAEDEFEDRAKEKEEKEEEEKELDSDD